MALNSMLVPLLILLPPFYSIEVGLDIATIGTVFMLARIWDALTDTAIGVLSDRTRTRWGRRKPWLVAALPATLIAAWFLLNPPANSGYVWLGLCLFFFYLFWSAMFIPYQSWGAELSADYNERTRVAGYRDGASFLGFLLASLLPLIVLQIFLGIQQPTYGQILAVVGGSFAIFLPIATALCLWAVPVKVELKPQAITWRNLLDIFLHNKPFQRLSLGYTIDRIAMGVYLAIMPLLIPIGLGLAQYFLILAVVNSVAAVSFSAAWVVIAHKVGKHTCYCIANGVTMLAYLMFLFIPGGGFYWALATFVVLGIGNAGTLITAPAMMADCVDYDYLKSGVKQTGAHMACLWMVTKIGFALGIGIGLNVLGFFGFDSQEAIQPESAITGLRVVTGLLPAVLLLPAIAIMWKFPLNRERHTEIRREIATRDLQSGA